MNNKIPFVESIPSDWRLIPNKYLFVTNGQKVGGDWNKYQLLSLTTAGVKEKDINSGGGKIPDSYDNYQTVKSGQMIFCLFDLDCSAVFSGISHFDGMITSAYDVFSNTDLITNEFADYWFKYVFSNRYYKMFSKNIRYTITADMFKLIYTPVPPVSCQKTISSKLSKVETCVDTLIDEQKEQIEKLKEHKKALITKSVTNGLLSNNQLVKSDVYWLDKIPANWDVKKIKFAYKNRNEKYQNGTFPYIALENIESFTGKYLRTDTNASYSLEGSIFADTNDVIFGKLRPYLAKSLLIKQKSYVSSEFSVFCSLDLNSTKFLKYLFLSDTFIDVINSSTYGTKMPRANADFINNLKIALPSPNEQTNIAEYLDIKCDEIDKLISIKNKKIAKLLEYKKSIIYEFVIGKKEVSA